MAFNQKLKRAPGDRRGPGPLLKTVRLRPDGKSGISITMSSDVLPRIPANIGSHIEIVLGSDDDYGCFLLHAAKPSTDSFKIFRRGESSKSGSGSGIVTVKAVQFFGLAIPEKQFIDCLLTFTADGVICEIPPLKSRKLKIA